MKIKQLVLAIAFALTGVGTASATTITFDNIADPGGFVAYYNGPLVLSGVSFTGNGEMFVIDPGYYGSAYTNGGFLSSDFASINTVTAALPSGIHFISFDLGGLFGPVDAFISINGGAPTAISSLNSITGTAALSYFSFSSGSEISTVTFSLPDGPNYNAIDNFTFLASNVPETSTWAMIILGFAGVGFMAYRRSRKDQGVALVA